MSKKIGLCLGSGGARGVAHIGFLQALLENDIIPEIVTGCSMGSLVGAMYLCGYSPEQMLDLAIKLKKNDVFDFSIGIIKNKALLKSVKFEKLLNRHFGDRTIESLDKPYAAIATDLISGKVHTFTDGLIKTAVRASCAIPLGFTPVKYNDMLLVDGGISYRTPVKEARMLGADVVIAVDVLGELPESGKITNIFNLGFRIFDIMAVNINDFQTDGQIADLMFMPSLGQTSPYKVENQQFCYDKGYELGISSINKIKSILDV